MSKYPICFPKIWSTKAAHLISFGALNGGMTKPAWTGRVECSKEKSITRPSKILKYLEKWADIPALFWDIDHFHGYLPELFIYFKTNETTLLKTPLLGC